MTEKRFTYFKSKIGFGKQGIDDNLKGYTFDFTLDNVLDIMNDLNEENEQLKKDCTNLICHNQEYRKENEQLKQQLNYIQNSISEHIKHQKTELGQKALKEIIEDYNEWLLGHKELQE